MTDDARKPVKITLDIEQWQYDFAVRLAATDMADIPVTSPDDFMEIIGTEKAPNWNSAEDFLAFTLFAALTHEIPQDQWPDDLKPVTDSGPQDNEDGTDPESRANVADLTGSYAFNRY